MKKYTILILLFSSFLLTGCIQKRPQPIVFDDQSTQQFEDQDHRFDLRIPNGEEVILTKVESGARLFRISEKDTGYTHVYLEETPTTMSQAVDQLSHVDSITVLSQEPTEINGLRGTKVVTHLKTTGDKEVPYYLMTGKGYTYIFSLAAGESWDYFEDVVHSFMLAEQQPESGDSVAQPQG